MGRRRVLSRPQDKSDLQPVLFNDAELMTVLADDVPVAGEFPNPVRFLHLVATVAILGVFLDIVVVTGAQHEAQRGNDQQQRNNDRLVGGAQAPFQFVEYFCD